MNMYAKTILYAFFVLSLSAVSSEGYAKNIKNDSFILASYSSSYDSSEDSSEDYSEDSSEDSSDDSSEDSSSEQDSYDSMTSPGLDRKNKGAPGINLERKPQPYSTNPNLNRNKPNNNNAKGPAKNTPPAPKTDNNDSANRTVLSQYIEFSSLDEPNKVLVLNSFKGRSVTNKDVAQFILKQALGYAENEDVDELQANLSAFKVLSGAQRNTYLLDLAKKRGLYEATKVSGDAAQGYKVRVTRVAIPLAQDNSKSAKVGDVLSVHPDKLVGKDFSKFNTIYFNKTLKGFVLDVVQLK